MHALITHFMRLCSATVLVLSASEAKAAPDIKDGFLNGGGAFGLELTAKSRTTDAHDQPSGWASTAVAGWTIAAFDTLGTDGFLIEGESKGGLKIGRGRAATLSDTGTGFAIGVQLTGRFDLGLMPMDGPCGLYFHTGAGAELRGTAVSSHLSSDVPGGALFTGPPDARAWIMARLGAGYACASSDLGLFISAYVGPRSDTVAEGSGLDIGVRATLLMADNLALIADAGRTSVSSNAYEGSALRGTVTVQKNITADIALGLDAGIAHADLVYTPGGTPFVYDTTETPLFVSLSVIFVF